MYVNNYKQPFRMTETKSLISSLPYVPMVSIIMNCYNGEKYLRQSIESVLCQTYQNWEIIFWDNHSTDKSCEIFQSYFDRRLNYYYNGTHVHLSEARNQAVLKSKGELIAFLDVDDYWLPNKLKYQVPSFTDPQVGMSCANYYFLNERTHKKHKIKKIAFTKPLASGYVLNELLSDYYVHFSSFIVRREALAGFECLFDRRFSVIHDFDLVIRLSLYWKLDSLQQPMSFYRWHDKNYGFISWLRISDEYKLWYESAKLKPAIINCPNFKVLTHKIKWYEIVKLLYNGDRYRVILKLKDIPNFKKIKILIAIILPTVILRKWLDRS
jgi:glycosyltransferase involved in cell wall biosynthesis